MDLKIEREERRAMRWQSFFLGALLVGNSLVAAPLYAEEEKKEKSPWEGLPQSGTLALTSSGGPGNNAQIDMWAPVAIGDSELKGPPLSASVSKVGVQDWLMKLFNNTPDTVTAQLRLTQLSKSGSQVKSTSFLYTLRGNQSIERRVSALPITVDCRLDLQGWTVQEAAKQEKEATSGEAETTAE
jgi:hypothetical protein